MNIKISRLSIILVFAAATSYAQQQVMFTQYMFNYLALNPAYAGSHESLTANALFREQWSGLDGAPVTQTFSIHAPIKNQKMGLGLLFLHDKIGVTSQTGAYGSYAYRISFTNGAKLALGVQAGYANFNAKFSQVSTSDPSFATGDVIQWKPTFGGGIFYSTNRFYAGLSLPQINETTFYAKGTDPDAKLVRHYFASTGYVFDLNDDLKLKPNVLLKYVQGAPLEFDINANLLIQERIWLGLSWRSFDSIDALFQLQVNRRIQIGYSYDFATQADVQRVNSGSHEFMLSYSLPVKGERIVTPRYF